MIATLKFNLSDDDEQYQFNLMLNAINMKTALDSMRAYLRSCNKHGMREGISVEDAVAEIFEMFHDYLVEHGVAYVD